MRTGADITFPTPTKYIGCLRPDLNQRSTALNVALFLVRMINVKGETSHHRSKRLLHELDESPFEECLYWPGTALILKRLGSACFVDNSETEYKLDLENPCPLRTIILHVATMLHMEKHKYS